jgi:hypothetical protein
VRDVAGFARQVLRPHRARLAEARTVVVGADDAAEAWSLLQARALVPVAPVAGAGGVYRSAGRVAEAVWRPLPTWPCPDWAARGADVMPQAVDDAVTLAADPEGLARASALALRVWHALATRQGDGDAAAVWVGVAGLAGPSPETGGWLDALAGEVVAATGHGLRAEAVWRAVHDAAPRGPWAARAADAAAVVVCGEAAGVVDATLVDALWGLWETGYALGAVTARGALLVAPRV